MATRLQQRFIHIAGQRRAMIEQLQPRSTHPTTPVTNPDLIDQLPATELDLLKLPEEHQRRLFDAFQLELRYDRRQHRLTIRTTLRADTIQALQQAINTAAAVPPTTPPPSHHIRHTETGADTPTSAPANGSHARRAPSTAAYEPSHRS